MSQTIDITSIVNKDGEIILYFNCPSLGDYLMMSNLPELWFQKYNVYTYISSECVYHLPETYDVIFKYNPYVKGISDKKYNVLVNCKNPLPSVTMTQQYQDRFQLNGNTIPKLYYQPKKIDLPKNTVLLDIASRNYKDSLSKLDGRLCDLLNNIQNTQNINLLSIKYKNPSNDIGRYTPNGFAITHLDIDSVFDYLDLVNSVDGYIGVNSGSYLLTCSIKEYYNKGLDITVFTPDDATQWIFNNTDNIITTNKHLG